MPDRKPNSNEIRRLVATIGKDPQLLNDLLNAGDDNKRKDVLVKRNLLGKEVKGSRQEIARELERLATPADGGTTPAPGARPVEWVGAIATAAAGAAAAVCTGD
jgi:hypothetical protein